MSWCGVHLGTWLRWDGFFLFLLLLGGFGRSGPTVTAFHWGGNSEAALSASGAPDDSTLLGEVHGQAWAKVGQSGWGLFCELRWALHWYKPIHLESSVTDPEIQASLLRKPFWLISAVCFWKRRVIQERNSSWWDGWRNGYGELTAPTFCHTWTSCHLRMNKDQFSGVGLEGHCRSPAPVRVKKSAWRMREKPHSTQVWRFNSNFTFFTQVFIAQTAQSFTLQLLKLH